MRLTTTAEALNQARKAGGKSQMDMAAEMDITRRTVQHWENGESEPTVSQLYFRRRPWKQSALCNTININTPTHATLGPRGKRSAYYGRL